MTIAIKLESLKGAVEKAPFFFRLFFSLLAGIGLSYIQAPYDLWYLIFPCFGLFYYLYACAGNKTQVFLTGFVFGIGYFVTGLNWIGNALLVEGNEYRWVWPLAVIALPTLLALFTALYTTISHMLFRKNTFGGFIGFCLLLVMSEWVRGYAFTGFPWNLYGYGWLSVLPMAQSVSLFGPYGLTLLTIFWGASLGFLLSAPRNIPALVIAVLTAGLVYGFGVWRLSDVVVKSLPDKAVHIVQPNIPQADKWNTEKLAVNFDKIIALSNVPDKEKETLIVWPETAIPPIFIGSAAVSERVRSLLYEKVYLLTGALEMEQGYYTYDRKYYNSLMAWEWSDKEPLRMYSKSHLVPFGEYIPFQKFIPLRPVAQFTGFQKGDGPATMGVGYFSIFSPLICYEIIFPHKAVNQDMDRPDFILTITNDAWYGDSAGPRQHFAQARFRAIEQGLPVIRSANTGISGAIDPYGRVLQKLDLMQAGAITIDQPDKLEKTYYGMFGDRIFLLMIVFLFGFSLVSRKKDLP